MSPEQIEAAEDVLRDLLDPDVARLTRPVLPDDHVAVLDAVEGLSWGIAPVEAVANRAIEILAEFTQPGGLVDPARDDVDIVWVFTLKKMATAPKIGARMARAWYVRGMRLLGADAEVSAVHQAMAAYTVARFADALGDDHEVARWMLTGSIDSEFDERAGLGLAVVVRAAKLLTVNLVRPA